jgi:AAA domain
MTDSIITPTEKEPNDLVNMDGLLASTQSTPTVDGNLGSLLTLTREYEDAGHSRDEALDLGAHIMLLRGGGAEYVDAVEAALQGRNTGRRTATTGRRIELTPASRIRSERIRWLDRARIPLGGLTALAGEKGLGKSTLTNAKMAADVTRGMLDGDLAGKPADVLLCTGEDDWATVVKPRLLAHGADLDRVHRVQAIDEAGASLLTLPDDIPALAAEVRSLADAGHTVALVQIDPIGAFIATTTDTHRDAPVRRVLAPLAAMAEEMGTAVVICAHFTKDDTSRLINRVSGSGAFVNAARSVLALVRSPDDPEGERGCERVLVHVASNWGRLAPSLALRIESRDVTLDDGSVASVGYARVIGETDVAVEDVQRGQEETSGADVEEAIAAALGDGPLPSRAVKAKVVAETSCGRRTVERAAARMTDNGELEITSGGFPKTTTWTLVAAGAQLPLSGASTSTPVAPSPNTIRGATVVAPDVTGFSDHSGACGAVQADSGATDATALIDRTLVRHDKDKGGMSRDAASTP